MVRECPNNFVVHEAPNKDASVVMISQARMTELKIYRGDIVLIKSPAGLETVGVVLISGK
jgi:formylmethanofuran dehydrogenase subunit D